MTTPIILSLAIIIALLVLLPVLTSGFGTKTPKQGHHSSANLDKRFIQEKWSGVESIFNLGGSSNLKNSIIEADKLVDFVLKAKGYPGQTMGERMKATKNLFNNYADYDNFWFAHKVRNNIVHEAAHELNIGEARRTIEYYKKVLKIFGQL